MEFDGLTLKSGIYSMVLNYDIKQVQEKLMILYSKYEDLYKN